MTAESLIAEFQALGVELIADPNRDKIKIRPAGIAPADLKERLRQRKAEVLAVLTSTTSTTTPEALAHATSFSSWPTTLPGLGHRRVIAFTPCADCETDTPEDDVLNVGPYEVAVPGPRHTFVSYGDVPLCRRHARAREAGR